MPVYRSQCRCPCHRNHRMVHCVPCCKPDPVSDMRAKAMANQEKRQQIERAREIKAAFYRDTTPEGWKRVELVGYTDGKTVIVSDESHIDWTQPDGAEDDHNCDEMGCGLCHVLARFKLPQRVEGSGE